MLFRYFIFLVVFFEFSKAIEVKVFTPKKEKIKIYYKVDGRTVADKKVELKPEVSGTVKEIPVKEGQSVKKGQILLKIENTSLVYRYQRQKFLLQKQKETLRYLQFLYERKKILFDKQLISEDEFRLAEKNYTTAKNDLKALEKELQDIKYQLQKTTVKAPFDAVLDKRYTNEGDFVTSATKLFYLYDPKSILITFFLPQRFINKVNKGQKVEFTLNKKRYTAEIVYISNSLTPESLIQIKARPLDVKFKFENLFLKVNFVEKQLYGYKIPEMAVHMKKSDVFVYVVKNGVVEKKPINVLSQQYGYIITDTQFEKGEKVVLEAPFDIKEGAKVEATY